MSDQTEQLGLLYPDLMAKSELISILKQRYIKTESLEVLDKDELVELYNKYILPLPQRKYRLNRRGQQMTKKQVVASKKRQLESSEDNPDDQPKNKRRSTGNLMTSFDLPSSGCGDRLKPPPSCINFEKKKIKINNNSTSSTETGSSSLDKLKINKINKLDGIKDDSVSSKKIKLSDSSDTNSSQSGDTSSASTEGTSKTSHNNHTIKIEDSSVKEKKKLNKISWP